MTTNLPPFLKAKGLTHAVLERNGNYLTEGLFYETRRDGTPPIYTLNGVDIVDPKDPGRVIYSFQREYLSLLDPTGYKASKAMLLGWEHWTQLLGNKQIRSYIDCWNDEINAQLRSLGYDTYIKAAKDGDLKAADWLIKQALNVPTGTIEPRPVGRPNKPPPAKPDESEDIKKDMERIRNG